MLVVGDQGPSELLLLQGVHRVGHQEWLMRFVVLTRRRRRRTLPEKVVGPVVLSASPIQSPVVHSVVSAFGMGPSPIEFPRSSDKPESLVGVSPG